MKKIMFIVAMLSGLTFAQTYRAGAFYGDIAVSSVSNLTLIGTLPPNAAIYGLVITESVLSTNTLSTNSIQIGIAANTNYFLTATQLPMIVANLYQSPTTGTSNIGPIINTLKPTPIYGYITRVGAQVSAVGTVRVFIKYVQK